MSERYFVGVDLGQMVDHTALAVLERAELKGDWDAAHWAWRKKAVLRLRHLERVPLGTPYPEVMERVEELVRSPQLEGRCELVVDATGVGAPVMEMLRYRGIECSIHAVTITGADQEKSEGGVTGSRSGTW
jgi:hypothetical protein